ncbi:hypothetical protein [uncultured Muribaculum sp.]|uniref:hypothetical protein n=1 Tax=uncultured Muribaculum sp. TaxID=1918613 RepID=UPI00273094D4|nr:hypothetical protein [uncultured Muribaculum sp.]
MAVTKADVSRLFMGQSDIILFDKVDDYNTAKISTLANPKSLGDIDQDSTSWTGDDPEIEPRRNEQGEAVTSRVTNGTQAYEFSIMSMDFNNVKTFLAPGIVKAITATTGAAWGATNGIKKVVGFGSTPSVMTRPIMLSNDEGDLSLLFPKAKIVSNLTLDDGMFLLHVSVTAEAIDTDDLDTAMLIEGKVEYVGESAGA